MSCDFLLLANGGLVLLEDGSKIILAGTCDVVSPMADYNIIFINPYSGEVIDQLPPDMFIAVDYTITLNDIGSITLTLDESNRIAPYAYMTDMIIEVWRNRELEQTYLLRSTDREERQGKNTYVIGGKSLEDLLKRRLIDPDDDPLEAGGYSTKSGSADEVMVQYVQEQCVNPASNPSRAFPFFTVGSTIGNFDNTFQRRYQSDNLFDVLRSITEEIAIDFQVVRITGLTFQFQATRIGEDKTLGANYPSGYYILFDPEQGNMINPHLMINANAEITHAYLAGDGIEEDRIYIQLPSGASAVSPYNRIEKVYDVRLDESLDQILAQGNAQLFADRRNISLEFDPLLTGSLVYEQDWDLGDRVTGRWGAIQFDYRIDQIKVSLDGSNGEVIKPRLRILQ